MTTVSTSVNLKWVDATFMIGVDSRGRPVAIGSKTGEESDWLGLKASDLLLLSAAACSTYDVVTILSKQREPFTSVDVKCTGEQNPEPPYAFVAIHLHYVIRGSVQAERVDKAIKLSEDKYCSVIATLRHGVQITSDFEILNQ
jgi:putative redox protein